MKKLFKIIFSLALFAGLSEPSLAQNTKWIFLPGSHVFNVLLADPRDPNNSLMVSPDTTRYDLSLGGSIDIAELRLSEEDRWAAGVMGAAYLNINRYSWASFRLEENDLWYGLYLSQSSNKFSSRLEYQHESAHLGDWLFGTPGTQFSYYNQTYTELQAFNFQRDLTQWTGSYQVLDFLRFYVGVGYWLYSTPAIQPLFVHMGTEIFSNYFDIIGIFMRGFFAYDLKIGDQMSNIVDENFQIGVQMKPSKENLSALNLTLDYYTGNSQYGQFYLQNDNHIGLELNYLP